MLSRFNPTSIRSNAALVVSAALLVFSFIVMFAALSGQPADAAKAKPPVAIVLGGDDEMPDPLYPVNCQVIPSVSGIQATLPSGNTAYRAPANGKVTAWKLWLGKPSAADRRALNQRFGSPAQAGIAVVQKLNTPTGEKFRLQRRSPVEGLSRLFGRTAVFRLAKPLIVRKGQIVALTVPTWAPAFAAGLNRRQYSWRASRQPNRCAAGFVDQATPQLGIGSKRAYGCSFKGSRLLFTARLKFD